MNNPRDFWQELLLPLRTGAHCVLMSVVESTGSSPGRAGFKMFVSSSGTMCGSIGGGSMEHKLVELARSLMDQPAAFPFLKRQIHREGEARDRSGMICSGEQTVAFFFLSGVEHQHLVEGILAAFDDPTKALDLEMSSTGLRIVPTGHDPTARELSWSFREPLRSQPRVAIVGAGHVSLALSRLMEQLGFRVEIYDDRPWLNTWHANTFAHRTVVEHARVAEHLSEDPELFVVLASFGYRTDDIVLRQLVRNRYRYIGMLGSAEKVRVMFEAMRSDGFTEEELARVHAPIGLPIRSRTPEEIAVSIAAEIIRVKNG